MEETRCGYAAIFGKPNAGKSTLLNALLGMKLSIVNRKAQTTRNKVQGILTEDNCQIIFFDTPGIIEPKYELQKFMASEIKTSLDEADVVLHLIDAATLDVDGLKKLEEQYGEIFKEKTRIVVLNKIDLLKSDDVLVMMDRLKKEFGYEHIVPVSAQDKFNLNTLKKVIIGYLPVSPFLYDEETVTDKPEKFFVAEIIRQKILEMFHEEIPYSVFVDIREFKERENRKNYINADIILERESQKAIIIGKKGEMLKKLGRSARIGIEKFLEREVYLELFIKVRKDWRKNETFLKENF
jgi:GTP-binding protein Era